MAATSLYSKHACYPSFRSIYDLLPINSTSKFSSVTFFILFIWNMPVDDKKHLNLFPFTEFRICILQTVTEKDHNDM